MKSSNMIGAHDLLSSVPGRMRDHLASALRRVGEFVRHEVPTRLLPKELAKCLLPNVDAVISHHEDTISRLSAL
jgi:hypothetical protein